MENTKRIFSISLVLIITFIAFLPCLKNGFVNWDDDIFVTDNSLIRNLTWANIKRIFTSVFFCNYHPLTVLSYSLDYHFCGLNPFGYHLMSLVLHVLNSFLVFWLFYIMTGNLPVTFITALFFGIHPLRVESVAWISGRKDVLYAFFFLSSIISYIRYLRGKKISKYYYFSLILFILSLLSKAMAVTLPVVLLFIDYFLYRRRGKGMIIDKIPFVLLSLIHVIITAVFHYRYGCAQSESAFSLLYKLGRAIYSIIFYLGKILMPVKLSCLYPYAGVKQHTPLYLYSSIAVIILFAAIIISGRHTRKAIFAGGFFLVTLIPVLQFIRMSRITVSDHYVYIPAIGVFYAVANGFFWLYTRRVKYARLTRVMLAVLLAAIMCVLVFLTRERTQVWKDSLTLWNDVLSKYPDIAVAYNNRGNAYRDKGDLDRAIADYTKSIKFNPAYARAYLNRGIVYVSGGSFAQALADYNKAIELNPAYVWLVYNARATLYYYQNNISEAIADYTRSIESNPVYAEAYNNRGSVYFYTGNLNQAIADYTKAIEIDPNYSQAYYNRGNAYQDTGNFDQALSDYNRAIKFNPAYAEAYNNRAYVYYYTGNLNQAIADYTKVIELRPTDIEAYRNRANVYLITQEYEKSWQDVYKIDSLGGKVSSVFLEELEKVSGRKK